MKNYKSDFTFLESGIIYLDSASTSLKPKVVIDEVYNHLLSNQLTENRSNSRYSRNIANEIEKTKTLVKDFINAKSEKEIIFTNGATDSSNLIALHFAFCNLQDGDEIMLCREDHISTIKPWLDLIEKLKTFNINIKIVDIVIKDNGCYRADDLISKVNEKTKFVILTHIHNIYGINMDVDVLSKGIREKNKNTKIVLDASQSIGHISVDVQNLDVDFCFFSGHKMFALTGIGVLYVKEQNFNLLKNKDFNFGTLNTVGILSLKSAINYINNISLKNITEHVYELTRYLYDKLKTLDGIIFNKGIDRCFCAVGYGIISFKMKNIPTADLVEILNDYDVVVRGGNFCNDSNDDYIRVSLHIYNDKGDIDKLIKILDYVNKKAS